MSSLSAALGNAVGPATSFTWKDKTYHVGRIGQKVKYNMSVWLYERLKATLRMDKADMEPAHYEAALTELRRQFNNGEFCIERMADDKHPTKALYSNNDTIIELASQIFGMTQEEADEYTMANPIETRDMIELSRQLSFPKV